MHFRRFASLALGGWLAGSLLLIAITSHNVQVVESLVRTPAKAAAESMIRMQESDVRLLMAYHADDVNRWAYGVWEVTQMALGVAVLLGLLLSAGGKRYTTILCLMMIAAVIFQHWFVTPQTNRLAQTAIFVKPDQVSVERDRMASMQTAYLTTEGVKLLFGVLLAGGLLKRGRRRRETDID
jgi:hypothetical protein